jgi:hypothetical protein
LENRDRRRIGVPKTAKRGKEAQIGRFLESKKYGREASGHFPNSFSTHSGAQKVLAPTVVIFAALEELGHNDRVV